MLVTNMLLYGYRVGNSAIYIKSMSMLETSSWSVWYSYLISWKTIGMFWLITIICLGINIYVIYYMSRKNNWLQYWLSLFSMWMIVIVISSNMILSIIGYEMIGWISFVLINYYVYRLESNKCSLISMLIGKLGDIGLIYSIMRLCSGKVSFNYIDLLYISIIEELSLLICCISKSAQYFLHSWLILAMNGRTRVSALLLSSTLVTSGLMWFIILKIKISLGKLVILLCIITFIMIGVTSSYAFDSKRVIAYSTSCQMSFVLIIVSLGYLWLGILLIITLGINKSLLFLTTGIVISLNNLTQDLRRLWISSSLTKLNLTLTTLNLIGFIFTSIFISKELIIYKFELNLYFHLDFLIILASFVTIYYSIRLYVLLI